MLPNTFLMRRGDKALVVLIVIAIIAVVVTAAPLRGSSKGVSSAAASPAPGSSLSAVSTTEPRLDAARAALAKRMSGWDALLGSIDAKGQDRSGELAGYLAGPPDEVAQAAADCQSTGSVTPASIAGGNATAPFVHLVELNPTGDMASVIATDTVTLPDRTESRRVLMETWRVWEGQWCRNTAPMPYWSGGKGKRPIYQGTQVDYLVWSIDHVQELPREAYGAGEGSLLAVSFDVRSQDRLTVFPSDYVLRLYGPDGAVYDVSSLTDSVVPGSSQAIAVPLQPEQHRAGVVVFEIPAGVDLLSLQYEVAAEASATTSPVVPGSTLSTSAPENLAGPQAAKAGTAHSWALATTALLTHLNGESDELLGLGPLTSEAVQGQKESLKKWWGVNDRSDLLAMLRWVDEGGHRKEWEAVATKLKGLDSQELAQVLAKAASNAELQHQLDMVRHYAPSLGAKSLIGWDYSRYIYLCRCGYACGYLTEAEAWDLIMPVAAMLQDTFSSWEELGENYLIGREFWSSDETFASGGRMRDIYQSLLSDAGSPWKVIPWGVDLR